MVLSINAFMMNVQAYIRKHKCQDSTRYGEANFEPLHNTRRYYDTKSIELLKYIKFLLKSEGMTIQGVKKHLNLKKSNLDDSVFTSIRTKYFKNKLSNLKNIIKELKK